MARKVNTTRSGNSGVLKDGIYPMVVLDVEEKVSKNGNDQIVLQLAVLKGGKPSGRTIWDYLVFDDEDADEEDRKNQWKFDQFHDALDVEEGLEVSAKWYKNRRFYASLYTDEYNGKVSNKIRAYLNPDVAKDLLARQSGESGAIENDDDTESSETEEVTPSSPVAREAAKMAGKGKRVGKTQVAELEEETEGMPF